MGVGRKAGGGSKSHLGFSFMGGPAATRARGYSCGSGVPLCCVNVCISETRCPFGPERGTCLRCSNQVPPLIPHGDTGSCLAGLFSGQLSLNVQRWTES